jgi:hypothetical protein
MLMLVFTNLNRITKDESYISIKCWEIRFIDLQIQNYIEKQKGKLLTI